MPTYNQYEVSYYPEDNPNSSIPFVNSWDIPGTGADADLLLKVKYKDSSSYLFSSPILDNQSPNSAAYWTAPVEFKLLNTDYQWEFTIMTQLIVMNSLTLGHSTQ